ncbi:MAG: T9SS type A sorting domain-containing protein [Chitinophagales bacterium]
MGLIDAEKPDLYIKIDDLGGEHLTAFPYPPITWSLGVELDPAHTYTMQMKDQDGGGTGSDDNCGSFTFSGDDVGVNTLSSGSNEVEVGITHPVISYVFYDTITVYPFVDVPVLTIDGLTAICADDSTILSTSWDPDLEYQWYQSGAPIPEADSSVYVVHSSGSYMLQVTGAGGCTAFSDSTTIDVFENPDPPAIIVIGNTLTTSSTWDVQWYFNGSPIPGADSTTYIPAIEGIYQVAATNGPCVAWSVEIDFDFQDITSQLTKPLEIYPNPNSGIFSFSFDAEEHVAHVQIMDLPGHIIQSMDIQRTANGFQGIIDLQALPAGMYIFQLRGDHIFAEEKIIIQ